MFNKHVWSNRRHKIEVFLCNTEVIGSIVNFESNIILVNPKSEILSALYSEGKIKNINSINTILLTNKSIECSRGLCSVMNYFKVMRRRKVLTVITRNDAYAISMNNWCLKMFSGSIFPTKFVTLKINKNFIYNDLNLSFKNYESAIDKIFLKISSKVHNLYYLDSDSKFDFLQKIDSEIDVIINEFKLEKAAKLIKYELEIV